MSNIKIQDVYQRRQYTATAGQTVFSVPFPFFENSDLTVWKDETELTITTDYTVSGAGSPSGGSVTLTSAASSGDIITIQGLMPIDRTSIYSATISNLTGSDLNNDFNRDIVMLKQLETTQEILQLQYKPYAEVSQDVSVTRDRWIPRLGALQFWGMNKDGTKIEAFDFDEGQQAPADASYFLAESDGALPNSFDFGSLTGGLLKHSVSGGVSTPATAIAATDYWAPGNDLTTPNLPVSGTDVTNKNYVDSQVNNSVTSGQGTANQVLVNGTVGSQQTGDLVFTLPQDIAASSTPTFAGGTLTGALNMSSQRINNVLDPSAPQDSATKQYVDEAVKDVHFLNPVRVASTANFSATYDNGTAGVGATLTATANGAASIDSISLSLNDRVLFKNQTSDLQNGIYYVSQVGDASNPAIYTRATDFDEPNEIVAGDLVPVLEGTANEKTMWIQTADVNTIGTDSITFVQFSADFSNVVTIDGAQAITGSKTFTQTVDANSGINFGDDTLSKYEEDVPWTPVLVGSVVAGSPTGTFLGKYTRIGDRVFATAQIVLTSLGGIEGNIEIQGLPYPVRSGTSNRAGISVGFRNNFVNNFVIGGFTQEGQSKILLYNMEVDHIRMTHSDFGSTSNLYFSIEYATSA